MKLSTRSRYAVRLMLALGRNHGKGSLFLKDMAREEGLSEKYLSQIIIPLRGAGLVTSSRGARGGYTLALPPSEITLRRIIESLEGGSIVDCVRNPQGCERSLTCASRDIWQLLDDTISKTLNDITLEQLLLLEQEKREQSASHAI